MLHNVFNCNLLLVNLEDMFSNVSENQACWRRVYVRTKNTPGNNMLSMLFIGLDNCTIYPYTHVLWELPGTCGFLCLLFRINRY